MVATMIDDDLFEHFLSCSYEKMVQTLFSHQGSSVHGYQSAKKAVQLEKQFEYIQKIQKLALSEKWQEKWKRLEKDCAKFFFFYRGGVAFTERRREILLSFSLDEAFEMITEMAMHLYEQEVSHYWYIAGAYETVRRLYEEME